MLSSKEKGIVFIELLKFNGTMRSFSLGLISRELEEVVSLCQLYLVAFHLCVLGI